MLEISLTDKVAFLAFWLSFSRWMAILSNFPLFDSAEIPGLIKIFASLLITFAFFPMTESVAARDIVLVGADNFWILTIFYTLMGLLSGQFVKMIMNIFIGAGVLITQSVGFSAIRYFDPTVVQTLGPFEKLIQSTVLMIILISGAMIPMFRGALLSFDHLSLFNIKNVTISPDAFFLFFKSLFLSSLLLAGPLCLSNLMITFIMGIIARMVPQMNILMVSFTVNIGLGLLIFSITSDEFFHIAFKHYTEALTQWFNFIT